MPTLISGPARIEAAGNKPILIDEFIGQVANGNSQVSVAYLKCPAGWIEPGQTPEFEEITVVLKGTLRIAFRGGAHDVRAGQAIVTHPGEWVQYSTLESEGAEYIAVCLPAFSMELAHREI